ncbi:MAG: PD-(D/E)XK nuclease family protein [Oscillospiraceae bacterium]|nr:PD-(D/E)XK nuclease family protein [Oscillospiraceae bacterium]
MLKIIYGKAGSGKTYKIKNIIAEMILSGSGDILFITPEQDSFRSESDILSLVGADKTDRADVLSFKRLAKKITDVFYPDRKPAADENSRRVIMSTAVESVSDSLDIFSRCTTGNAVGGLLGAADEFSQCGVKQDELKNACIKTGNEILEKKAEELNLIFSAYNAILSERFSDASDELTLCAEAVLNTDILNNKTVFIDGFSGFTAQEYALISALIQKCRDVYIAVCCDAVSGKKNVTDVFYYTFGTVSRLKSTAKRLNVKISAEKCEYETEKSDELKILSDNIYSPVPETFNGKTNRVTLCRANDPADEASFISCTIRRLVREKGYRYSDFAVIGRGEKFSKYFPAQFKKYGVRFFEDETSLMKNEPLVRLADGALYCAVKNFDTEHILKCLKTSLYTDLSESETADIENYTVVWDISPAQWLSDWTRHPDGYGFEINDRVKKRLDKLNESRRKIVAPIIKLKNDIESSESASDYIKALYDFLIYSSADKNMLKTAKKLCQNRREDLALRSERVWDDFMALLDSFNNALSDRKVSPKRFYELFKVFTDKAETGDIPREKDRVTVGDALRIRIENIKVAFIAGANEGVFPQNNSASFVLTGSERRELKKNSIELYEDGEVFASKERYLVYRCVSTPADMLFVSCTSSDMTGTDTCESEILREVKRIVPECTEIQTVELSPLERTETYTSAFETAAANFTVETSEAESVREFIRKNGDFKGNVLALERASHRQTAKIEKRENAENLFGKDMYLSPSAIEDYHKCPFRYFCKFGLRVKALKKAELNSAVHGLVVHYVLENMFRFHTNKELIKMDENERRSEIKKYAGEYVLTQMSGESDTRLDYRLRRIEETIDVILRRLIAEFSMCEFETADVELNIGKDGEVREYTLALPGGGTISLHGIVDRVDVMKTDNESFVRVIDYKTGGKDFKLSDVPYGLNLQMLIYLMCLWQNGGDRYGNVVPAGVLYLPAKLGDISLGRNAGQEKIDETRINNGRMNGVILCDERVISGMDSSGTGVFLSNKIIKNGKLGNYALTYDKFIKLKEAVDEAVIKTAEELHSGEIEIKPTLSHPYERTCEFCDYRAVCCREDGGDENIIGTDESWLFGEDEKNGGR